MNFRNNVCWSWITISIVLITVMIFAYYSLYARNGWDGVFGYGLVVGFFVCCSVCSFLFSLSVIKENPGGLCGWTISFIGYSIFIHFKYKDSNFPDSLEDYFWLTFAYSLVTLIFSWLAMGIKYYDKEYRG